MKNKSDGQKDNHSNGSVLVVDDNENLNQLICRMLQREGFNTDFAHTGDEAVEKITDSSFSLVLLDYRLRNTDAPEVIKSIEEQGISASYIIMTGFSNHSITDDMRASGVIDCIHKEGAFLDRLPDIVKNALGNKP